MEIGLKISAFKRDTSALRMRVCQQLRSVQDGEESRKRGEFDGEYRWKPYERTGAKQAREGTKKIDLDTMSVHGGSAACEVNR